MNTVVLLGTEHPIQLGEREPVRFKAVLIKECKMNNVKAVAEEINRGDKTIASKLAFELKFEYLYADPDIKERMKQGIPVDIGLDIIDDYGNKYPEIKMWPREASKDNLPDEVWEEYSRRTDNANRRRERVWLENINYFNKWPLLFICGANHFDEFAKLLKSSEFHVIESYKHWKPD